MYGVAADSYLKQYSHKFEIYYFFQRFNLVVSHHQEYNKDSTVRAVITADSLRLSWNVEENDAFDICGYVVLIKNSVSE